MGISIVGDSGASSLVPKLQFGNIGWKLCFPVLESILFSGCYPELIDTAPLGQRSPRDKSRDGGIRDKNGVQEERDGKRSPFCRNS
ncbi:MAG: hypothetical protein D3910_17920 [Candidatus Electrothrix sp. ATG2]|nr:hypothetical protein [Candidatus Electrothrix sp. ATG2]